MTTPPIRTAGRSIWTCDGCGQRSIWTPHHRMFGSLNAVDDGAWHRIVVTCSPKCKLATEAAGAARDSKEPVCLEVAARFGAPATR